MPDVNSELIERARAEIEHRLDLIREYGGFSVWAWANEISALLAALPEPSEEIGK